MKLLMSFLSAIEDIPCHTILSSQTIKSDHHNENDLQRKPTPRLRITERAKQQAKERKNWKWQTKCQWRHQMVKDRWNKSWYGEMKVEKNNIRRNYVRITHRRHHHKIAFLLILLVRFHFGRVFWQTDTENSLQLLFFDIKSLRRQSNQWRVACASMWSMLFIHFVFVVFFFSAVSFFIVNPGIFISRFHGIEGQGKQRKLNILIWFDVFGKKEADFSWLVFVVF